MRCNHNNLHNEYRVIQRNTRTIPRQTSVYCNSSYPYLCHCFMGKIIIITILALTLTACEPSNSLTRSQVSDKVELCQDINKSALVVIDRYGYYREVSCQAVYYNITN